MLILFAKNLVLQSERARLVETNVIQTRSSEDRKDFNVEQTRERTGRPVNTHEVTNVTDSSQTRSAHESETFNVEDKILRKRTERSVADHDVSHESTMVNEADMDFQIPGLPHSVVKYAQSTSVRELIQKIEDHPDPEYVIKKGRPHGHRYGKKPGDKEYYTANQLKKKCKKKDFQGIHDRFIRDQEFRNRMIENHRDEDLCRRWDVLADGDHTHHLTAQEYSPL